VSPTKDLARVTHREKGSTVHRPPDAGWPRRAGPWGPWRECARRRHDGALWASRQKQFRLPYIDCVFLYSF
jgi:hypothetical protein